MYSSSVSYRRRQERSRSGVWVGLFLFLLVAAVLGAPIPIAYLVVHPGQSPGSEPAAPVGASVQQVEVAVGPQGAALPGWLWRAPASEATVVLVHDYGQDRTAAIPTARSLVEAGFNVLLLDQRGHGAAPKELSVTFGGREPADLARVVSYVRSLGSAGRHVILMGWSLGANAALRTAAEMPEADGLVLVEPEMEARSRLDGAIEKVSPLPSLFFTTYTRWLTVLFFGVRPGEFRPAEEILKIAPRPTLFIGPAGSAAERLLSLSGREGNTFIAADGSGGDPSPGGAVPAYMPGVVQFLRTHFFPNG